MGISSRNQVKTSPLAPASPFIKKAQPHAVRQASSLGRSGSIASTRDGAGVRPPAGFLKDRYTVQVIRMASPDGRKTESVDARVIRP